MYFYVALGLDDLTHKKLLEVDVLSDLLKLNSFFSKTWDCNIPTSACQRFTQSLFGLKEQDSFYP